MYLPNLKFITLPIPEITAIAILGWGCEPQSWGRGGGRGAEIVAFERALVSSYRLSIVTFHLYLRVSQILPLPHPTSSLPKISPCSPGSRWMAFKPRRAKTLG